MLAFGSASELNREILVLLSINKNKKPSLIDYSIFVDRLRKIGIREINIEGATQVGSRLLLVNRGNQTNRKNHLIITTPDFWKDQEHCTIVVHELSTAVAQSDFLGVSEVHYVKSIDLLLFTFTSESTMNSYDDGIIGESYLGWIRSASKNRLDSVTELRRLSDIHGELKGQKIEGVCADEIGEDYLQLHLVADNDEGESKLFKVEMTLDER